MRRNATTLITVTVASLLGILSFTLTGSTEESLKSEDRSKHPPLYNPYPPGIVPADVESELIRVRHEVKVIFNRYFQEWKALPPPTLTGQPPTLQGTGYDAVRILGGLLNYDQD